MNARVTLSAAAAVAAIAYALLWTPSQRPTEGTPDRGGRSADRLTAAPQGAPTQLSQGAKPAAHPTSSAGASAKTNEATSAPPPSAEAVLILARAPSAEITDREIWQAARRLEATPSLAAELAAVAVAPGTLPRGRALALDLLAQANHPEAQAALITATGDPALIQRAGPRQANMLIQRVGMVADPGPALVEHTVALAQGEAPIPRRAALAAAGGLARRLHLAGEAQRAEALLSATVRQGPRADPSDEAARILGLGNAARPGDLPAVLAAASDPQATLRRAAARGLQRFHDPGAVTWLATLALDPDASVQRAALRSLSHKGALPSITIRALAAGVGDDRLARANDGLLVTVLSPHAGDPEARGALQAVAARADDDPTLRARIRSILMGI